VGYSCPTVYPLYFSSSLDEVARGDAEIASRRLEILCYFLLLQVNEAVKDIASQFLTKSNLPPKAADDALHIALATVYSLDYLLTWNCKHIANAQISNVAGYELPTICTPYELMGE